MDSFSALIRTASHEQHMEAETSTFMTDLLGGRLGVDAYARYTEQLWFVYEALESRAQDLASDRVTGPFVRPELFRLAALERDLEHLRGPDWRSTLTALPATRVYADRVAAVARAWPAGYVAHHYTRYLGDLSGGQIIRDKAERTWGFAKKATGSASTSSRGSPIRPRSSGSTARCWTGWRWTTWRSSASLPSASGRSR